MEISAKITPSGTIAILTSTTNIELFTKLFLGKMPMSLEEGIMARNRQMSNVIIVEPKRQKKGTKKIEN